MSTAASFLHSSSLGAISAVTLWPVHVQKFPQASKNLSLPSCRQDVMSAVPASLSARSFPLTRAWSAVEDCAWAMAVCKPRPFHAVLHLLQQVN